MSAVGRTMHTGSDNIELPARGRAVAGESPVAVLMCVYGKDKAAFFDRALKSIESQDYAEGPVRIYLCIDGVVGEELQGVIDGHAAHLYKAVQNTTNVGIARSLNRLLGLLEDERYVFRMDADDYSYPNRISSQIQGLRDNPGIGIIGSSIQEVDADDRVLRKVSYPTQHEQILDFIAWRSPFAHPAVCFKREAIERFGRYPELSCNEDIALWFRCMVLGIRMANLEEPLVRMTVSDDFFSRRNYRKATEEFKVWTAGLYAMHGLTWRHVCPVIRFMFRLLPQRVARILYLSSLR